MEKPRRVVASLGRIRNLVPIRIQTALFERQVALLSLNMMGNYIDRHSKTVKALIKSMSESLRALQTDQTGAKIAIKSLSKPKMVKRSSTRLRVA